MFADPAFAEWSNSNPNEASDRRSSAAQASARRGRLANSQFDS
jgi:hypothetical protein